MKFFVVAVLVIIISVIAKSRWHPVIKALSICFFFVVLLVILTSNSQPKKEAKTVKLEPTATPELLIKPNTVTPTPTIVPTVRPTETPPMIRGSMPYYSEDGMILGFIDNSSYVPTATSSLSVYGHRAGCNIKGNVSMRNNGQWIYHCPNWRDYDRTEVNYDEGDRWFCSEEEAIAAGFRKPENVNNICIQ